MRPDLILEAAGAAAALWAWFFPGEGRRTLADAALFMGGMIVALSAMGAVADPFPWWLLGWPLRGFADTFVAVQLIWLLVHAGRGRGRPRPKIITTKPEPRP